jgi:hypothetical protein
LRQTKDRLQTTQIFVGKSALRRFRAIGFTKALADRASRKNHRLHLP